jgi:hypothetical protein
VKNDDLNLSVANAHPTDKTLEMELELLLAAIGAVEL